MMDNNSINNIPANNMTPSQPQFSEQHPNNGFSTNFSPEAPNLPEQQPRTKKTKIIVIAIILCLIIGLGIFLGLILSRDDSGQKSESKNTIISDFVDTVLYATDIDTKISPKHQYLSLNGKMTETSGTPGGFYMDISGEIGGGRSSFEMSPILQSGDIAIGIEKLNLVHDMSGTYIKMNGMNLDPLFGVELQNYLRENDVEDKWYHINFSDFSDLISATGEGSISVSKGADLGCLGRTIGKFVKSVKSNFFSRDIATLSEYNGKKTNENEKLFKLDVDVDLFMEFFNEISDKIPSKEMAICVTGEDVDSSMFEVTKKTTKDLKKSIENLPEIIIGTNQISDITSIYIDSASKGTESLIDIKVSYPDKIDISIPEDASPFEDVTQKVKDFISIY